MPLIFWAPPANPPMPYPNADWPAPTHGAVGDIYIRASTGAQHRWNGTSWDALEPGQTRGDVAPLAGQLNDRLSKAGARPFELVWRNAADGVVFSFTQTTPEEEWEIEHQLSSRFIDVTVISPGLNDPNAVQTIIVPDIQYLNPAICSLSFAEPVAGTALIRR